MTPSDAAKLVECAERDLASIRGALEDLEKRNWHLRTDLADLRIRLGGIDLLEAYEELVEKVLDVDRGVATLAEAVALARGN